MSQKIDPLVEQDKTETQADDNWADIDFTAAEPEPTPDVKEDKETFPPLLTPTIPSHSVMDLGSLSLDDLEFPSETN